MGTQQVASVTVLSSTNAAAIVLNGVSGGAAGIAAFMLSLL